MSIMSNAKRALAIAAAAATLLSMGKKAGAEGRRSMKKQLRP